MLCEDKFKEARSNLIENFLARIKDIKTLDDLGVRIIVTFAAIDLTFNKARREFIKTKFINPHPNDQRYKKFKKFCVSIVNV